LRSFIIGSAVVLVLLGGCGGSDGEDLAADLPPAADQSAADNRVDVTSGRPLSQFKDSPTYAFREALLENKDAVLTGMTKVAKHLEEKDLSEVLSTCDSIVNRGAKDKQLTDQTITRFSGGSGEKVDAKQAAKLIALSRQYVCPAS
jgi:hypothetical protein